MVKVKICANKSIEEAQMCLNAGADIIGILVGQEHTSNDFVNKETAKEIVEYVNIPLISNENHPNKINKTTVVLNV